ncbi:MAG TPA: sugar phosphate isomerase/epimerase family protein [Draconibacterium sp.]|nr:sugar phosphate isomerase/epimerase family protein [Draconibacterium sp.]
MITRRDTLKSLALLGGGAMIMPKTSSGAEKAKPGQFSYCLNTSTISGQKVGFLKEFEITSKAGYDGIEIWIRDLQKYMDEGGNLKDLKKYIDDLGLKVENAIGFAEWIVDDDAKRKAGTEQLKKEMDLLAQIGCTRIAAPPAGKYNDPITDWFEVADRYRKILEIGDSTGVTPQLEFWGASTSLFHISQAMFIATAANHPKACIMPDIYHMFRGGSGYHSLKLISGSAIEIFHFNDFVADVPREKQTDSDRVYPGDGAAPFKQIITDLYNSGGNKVLSLELFNKSYWEKDALEVAKSGLSKMKKLVNEAVSSINR